MGISNANSTDIVYISKRLMKKEAKIDAYHITVMDAPSGYGKSTLLRSFFADESKNNHIITCKNSDKEEFFKEFLQALKEIDKKIDEDVSTLAYPKTQQEFQVLHNLIAGISVSKLTYIVIDNYHYIGSLELDKCLLGNYKDYSPNLRIIILTQGVTSKYMYEQTVLKNFLYISKEDFELKEIDIKNFFTLYDVPLPQKEAKSLRDFSDGWISAVYLQMLHYKEKREIDNSLSIDLLLDETLWQRLTEKEKRILLYSSRFTKFSLKQLMFILNEEDGVEIEKTLTKCAFSKYDVHNKVYHYTELFKRYLDGKYQLLDITKQHHMLKQVAKWHLEIKEYFVAMKAFATIEDYESIYNMRITLIDLQHDLIKPNIALFVNIVKKCPNDIKFNNMPFLLLMCAVLAVLGESEATTSLFTEIELYLPSSNLDEKEQNHILGEISFIEAILYFNNANKMSKCVDKAINLLTTSPTILSGKEAWTFGSTSALCLYYNKCGKLWNIIDYFSKNINSYYKLTDGHGKGVEALMKAEALFYTGDLESAEILCHKALYMADTRQQYTIRIATLTLLARIAIFNGNTELLNNLLKDIKMLANVDDDNNNSVYNSDIIDLSLATIMLALDNPKDIASWLKESIQIENRILLQAKGYANILYGKYLILKKEYRVLLGISGQLLGIAKKFPQVLVNIYIYMYIAIANEKLGAFDKANKMLKIAIDYAKVDDVYIPFVENWTYIKSIVDRLGMREYISELKIIDGYIKKFNKQTNNTKKQNFTDSNYGLTKREVDVATLAAHRYSNKQIAEELYIAESTVKSTLRAIYTKLDVNSRTDLIKYFNKPPEK